MLGDALPGSPSRTARGQPLLPLWGQIQENICSDKESVSSGRGQASAHQLLQRPRAAPERCSLPLRTRDSQGQTPGLMAWKPAGGWRGQMCPNKRLADLGKAPSPQSACRAHCQCHGQPLSPTAPERAALASHPPAPHNQRHHQAGLETCVCSGKKNGTEHSGASGLCPHLAPRPRSLAPRGTQSPHGCALTPGRRGQAGAQPAAHRSGRARQPLCRQRAGDWAAAPRGRGLPARRPPAARPGVREATRL